MPPERCSRACRDRGSSVALLQAECTFERRAGLTAEEFRSEYYLKKPVIVTGGSGLLAGHGGQGPLLKDVEALFDEYSDVTVQVAATLRSWQEKALQQRGGVNRRARQWLWLRAGWAAGAARAEPILGCCRIDARGVREQELHRARPRTPLPGAPLPPKSPFMPRTHTCIAQTSLGLR